MNKSVKEKKKAFWSRAEKAGEGLEVGIRCLLGVVFAIGIGSAGYALGSSIWSGIGILLALLSILPGFLIGFFWVEIKFALKLTIRFFW